jgi:hypothetical protein
MKFLILSENSNGSWPYLYFRGIGAQELSKRITAAGYSNTVIDWFTYWTEDELKEAVQCWFGDCVDPVIAISTPFSPTDIAYLNRVLAWAKQTWPDLKVIHGGARVYDSAIQNVDVFFLGRSMQVFEDWMRGRDVSKYTALTDPLVLKNLDFDENQDTPVIPTLSEHDFYNKDDILGFEIGVGCKFNCTFCNYELRGAKISRLASSLDLHNFFSQAYNRYGIENFFIADDTPNETDTKLEILLESFEGLNFHPKITGFTRLDILAARPKQIELYKKIQFDSLFFGIESFNEQASKLLRKKSGLYNVYDTLKTLREICPSTFLVGGLIVGLNGDSEISIRNSVLKVLEEDLLDSIQLYPLSINKSQSIFDEGYMSQLDQDPEKFGYKTQTVSTAIVSEQQWVSDWSNLDHATKLADSIANGIKFDVTNLNHMEYAGLRSLGLIDNNVAPAVVDIVRKRAYTKSKNLKLAYVEKKLNFFRSLT